MSSPSLAAPPPEVGLDLSILVPVHNEEDNLRPLHQELTQTLDKLEGIKAEVVFVDDGSTDTSAKVLAELAQEDPERVRAVFLRRNYGQTAALDAALACARGRVLVPMDADLQNDPADIPAMLGEIARGADVVSGWRQKRQDTFLTRRVPSLIANALIARLTGVKIHDFGCTLKAYRREVLEGVRLYGEMHRFIPAYATWNGAKVVERVVNHRPRTQGTSKYGLSRTFKVVLDLVTVLFLQRGYVSRPLHVFGGCGISLVGSGVFLGAFTLWQKLLYPVGDARHIYVHRNPLASLAAMVVILGGGAIALGLLAELLTRIYHATTREPYALAGAYNVETLPTPGQARDLGPAFARLAEEHPPGGAP